MQHLVLISWLFYICIEAKVVSHLELLTGPRDAPCFGSNCPKKHIAPRAQREKCEAAKYPGPQHQSNVKATRSFNNVSIVRRAMDLPTPGLIDAFIMGQTGEDGEGIPVVWRLYDQKKNEEENNGNNNNNNNDDSSDDGNAYDVNTAVFYDYKQPRSLVATMLRGCTMLAIISRKGVYMGHYWESVSFAPNDIEPGDTKEEVFERSVILGLRNGVTAPERTVQMSLTRFVAAGLADDSVRAILIRPNQNDQQNQNGRDGYPDEWAKMKDEVVRIIPKIAEDGRWQTTIYNVIPDKATLKNTVAGRVLFKIDPAHIPAASRRGKATRLAVLWLENREIFRDQWHDP